MRKSINIILAFVCIISLCLFFVGSVEPISAESSVQLILDGGFEEIYNTLSGEGEKQLSIYDANASACYHSIFAPSYVKMEGDNAVAVLKYDGVNQYADSGLVIPLHNKDKVQAGEFIFSVDYKKIGNISNAFGVRMFDNMMSYNIDANVLDVIADWNSVGLTVSDGNIEALDDGWNRFTMKFTLTDVGLATANRIEFYYVHNKEAGNEVYIDNIAFGTIDDGTCELISDVGFSGMYETLSGEGEKVINTFAWTNSVCYHNIFSPSYLNKENGNVYGIIKYDGVNEYSDSGIVLPLKTIAEQGGLSVNPGEFTFSLDYKKFGDDNASFGFRMYDNMLSYNIGCIIS